MSATLAPEKETETPVVETPQAEPPKADPPKDAPPPETKPAAEEKVTPPVALIEYSLTPPENTTLDATVIERTTAIARELGLSNEAAQKTLEFLASEASAHAQAQVDATLKSYSPGGDEWKKRVGAWQEETKNDPKLGKSPEERQFALDRGRTVLRKYAERDPEGGHAITDFLDKSGLADHPAVVRFTAFLGKAMGEGEYVPAGQPAGKEKTPEQKMYPSMFNDDGTPKT